MANFTTTTYNREGAAETMLSAAKMVHYPDDDTTELVAPRVVQTQARRAAITVRADRGQLSRDGDEIFLYDNVVLVREAGAGPGAARMTTEFLHVVRDRSLVRTDREVKIVEGSRVAAGPRHGVQQRDAASFTLHAEVRAASTAQAAEAMRFLAVLLLLLAHLRPAPRRPTGTSRPQIEANRMSADDVRRLNIFEGNVVLTKGTHARQRRPLVVRQDAEGFQLATADRQAGALPPAQDPRPARRKASGSRARRCASRSTTATRRSSCSTTRASTAAATRSRATTSSSTSAPSSSQVSSGKGGDEPRVKAIIQPKPPAAREEMKRMTQLRAQSLRKRYKSRTVVQDVSLEVSSGEVVGLLGPNGAGKTTCFYMIVGLVPVDAGAIHLDSRDLTHLPIHRRARLGISYLPQENSVFRRLTVEENVQAILELQGLAGRRDRGAPGGSCSRT